MKNWVLAVLLTIFLPAICAAQEVEYSADINLWSKLTESFKAPGHPPEEFEYRVAPFALRMGVGFGHSWSVEGRVMYARLFGDNSPEKHSLGHVLDLEGSLGWHPAPLVRIYGGYTHTRFERSLLFPGRVVEATTTESGPLIGISAHANHDSPLILRGSFDLYPFLNVHDTVHPEANGFHKGNYGFRTEGAVGWWLTEHVGLYGLAGYQKISTKEGEDISLGRHEAVMTNAGVGMAFKF